MGNSVDVTGGVCIYGAGELGALAIEYCESCGIPILAVVDLNKTGAIAGKTAVYQIQKPQDVASLDRCATPIAVAVATLPYSNIAKSLKSSGWSTVIPFYSITAESREGHPLQNGWLVGQISDSERTAVATIRKTWADSASRSQYEAFLRWHTDEVEIPLDDHPIDPSQRYVIDPLVQFLYHRHHEIVDVGSHCGGAVQRFTDKGIHFGQYVLIEPDETSRSALDHVARRLRAAGASVNILPHILSESRGTVPFKQGLGYSSQIWARSTSYKSALPLDDLQLRPDLVKIHTEGTEWAVIKGAAETIREFKPALVYSVYHRREGFCWDIINPIKLFDGYTWYFRLHGYQGTGAFVYGIPAVPCRG